MRSVGFRDLDAGLSCVAGFGSDVWPRLFSTPPPAQLHPFRELAGDRHRAPATPGDLVLHIRAGRPDLCFELATQALTALGGAVTPVDEMQGFRFFDFRDLLGFVDGTENPTGRAATEATLIGAGGPGVRRRQLPHGAALPARPGRVERPRRGSEKPCQVGTFDPGR